MYDSSAAGSSELDAVVSSLNNIGLDRTRDKWESHWAHALTPEDLDFLSQKARCTSIRLPIGYFTLGPDFCGNTPFAMQPSEVYRNAWTALKNMVSNCYSHGIGVLIDLHAVPGGANGEAHSGTSSGSADLWNNTVNLDLATKCAIFVAQEIKNGLDGITGIQLCNESSWDPPGMYQWYDKTISAISAIDSTIPIYVSDGWDLRRCLEWSMKWNGVSNALSNPIIIDTHKYWTFSEKDTSRDPHAIIGQISTELGELNDLAGNVFDHKGAPGVFIGEYSCTLAPQTWARVSDSDRSHLVGKFGQSQSQKWQERATGATFWTYKMEWTPGGEWGFKEQVEKGSITAPSVSSISTEQIRDKLKIGEDKRSQMMAAAMDEHIKYWKQAAPDGYMEHWRYGDGWHLGWTDARDFLKARADGLLPGGGNTGGGDKIGALDLWILKRMKEEGVVDRAKCGFGWIWEQGFRRGMSDFYQTVKV